MKKTALLAAGLLLTSTMYCVAAKGGSGGATQFAPGQQPTGTQGASRYAPGHRTPVPGDPGHSGWAPGERMNDLRKR